MQHQLPRLSPPDGCCVAPQLVAVVVALAPLAAVALVVVFALTPAASAQS